MFNVKSNLSENYEIIDKTCEICGSSNNKILHERPFWNNSTNLINKDNKMIHNKDVICDNCGLVYKTPIMTEESLELFYESDYPKLYHYKNIGGISREVISESIITTAYLFDWLKKIGLDVFNKKTLDIGAGLGTTVYALKEYGADSFGIDKNERSCDIANKVYGVTVENDSIMNNNSIVNNKYDIIFILNTLEHFFSPKKIINMIYNMLRDNGKLIIEIPSIDFPYPFTIIDGFLSSAHVYTFSHTTITRLLNICGFGVERIDYDGHKKCMFILASKNNINVKCNVKSYVNKKILNETGLTGLAINNICKNLNQYNGDELFKTIEGYKYISNVLKICISERLINIQKYDKALKILRNFNTDQPSDINTCYGAFLTKKAICYRELGDFIKMKSLAEEGLDNFPHIFDYNFIKNAIIDGIFAKSSIMKFEYYKCCNLLKNIK